MSWTLPHISFAVYQKHFISCSLMQPRLLYKSPMFHIGSAYCCWFTRIRSPRNQKCAKWSLFSNPPAYIMYETPPSRLVVLTLWERLTGRAMRKTLRLWSCMEPRALDHSTTSTWKPSQPLHIQQKEVGSRCMHPPSLQPQPRERLLESANFLWIKSPLRWITNCEV